MVHAVNWFDEAQHFNTVHSSQRLVVRWQSRWSATLQCLSSLSPWKERRTLRADSIHPTPPGTAARRHLQSNLA